MRAPALDDEGDDVVVLHRLRGRRGASGQRRRRPRARSAGRQSGSRCREAPADSRCRPTSRDGYRRCPWRSRQRHVVAHADFRSVVEDDIAAVDGMLPHLERARPSVSAPGLFSRLSGTPTLPMSCSGASVGEQLDSLGRQVAAEIGMRRELAARGPRVLLRPPRMPAGFGVPDLDEREQRLDHQSLRGDLVAAGSIGADALDHRLARTVMTGERDDKADRRKERRQERAVSRKQRDRPAPTRPTRQTARRRAPQARPNATTSSAASTPSVRTTSVSSGRRVLGPAEEVPLQQVVGHRGLHFDAGEQRVERRRHHLARAEGGGADERRPCP